MREALAHAFSDAPVVSPARERLITLLQVINVAFAGAVVSAWTYLSIFIAEPISWATWMPLSRHGNPGLFDYPFSLLWGLPIGGVLIAYCAKQLTLSKLIFVALLLPIVMLGMIFGWFYLAPMEWR